MCVASACIFSHQVASKLVVYTLEIQSVEIIDSRRENCGCSGVPKLGFCRGDSDVPKLGFHRGSSGILKLGFRRGDNNIPKLGFRRGCSGVPKLGFHGILGFATVQTCDLRQAHAIEGATCSGVGRDMSGGG